MELNSPPGATPIDIDDLEDLIPRLTLREELNEFEERNIYIAYIAARKSRKLKHNLLNIDSLTWLHHQMFNKTWKWAGKFRTRETNIGVPAHQIRDQIAILCADAKYWLENSTYSLTEYAVRIHHKLAQIHPFVNGNGRHARLIADLIMLYNKQPELNWGGKGQMETESLIRERYLKALKKADGGKYGDLIKFALGKIK